MSQERVRELLAKAVEPSTLHPAGLYTRPASWGVYKLLLSERATTRRYRYGNHPVRQLELRREFGSAKAVAHYTSRALAVELAALLNASDSI